LKVLCHLETVLCCNADFRDVNFRNVDLRNVDLRNVDL
jgi:uncharacterized protein YjbI with pentapeptide repeats